jgi:hypothetical protein
VVESSSGGFKFPDGSLQITALDTLANWSVTGNFGTNPAIDYVGTADTAALVFKVNQQQAGRIEPADEPAEAANIILGHALNTVSGGAIGATISGGGRQGLDDLGNMVMGNYGSIGGGSENEAGEYSTVPGGKANAARGAMSFAAGSEAKANHDSSFVWNSGRDPIAIDDSLSTSAPSQFLVQAVGGIGMYASTRWDIPAERPKPYGRQILLYSDSVVVFGMVWPGQDGVFSLGSPYKRWNAIYAKNGVVDTSDYRLKEEIKRVPYGLEEVLRLEPVAFRWKDQPEEGERLGLIAQDVIDIVPTVVTVPDSDDGYYGIRYSELVPVLIKAIQEQQDVIEALSNRVAQLEGSGTH